MSQAPRVEWTAGETTSPGLQPSWVRARCSPRCRGRTASHVGKQLRLGNIHDSGPGAYAHVHHDGDLARTRVHVAVDEAGWDMEEVSWREVDGLLSVSTIVEPEPSGDEEPIQVSRPMMMPRRDRPDRNLRPHHDHVLVLERSVSTDPLGDRARCQMVLADDLDRWHEPDTRPPSITVFHMEGASEVHSTVTLFARFRGLSIGQSWMRATS